jgi:hypothetical protein
MRWCAGAAGLGGETGAGEPDDAGGAQRVKVQLVGGDLQIRRLGVAVEDEREVVRGEDFAERQRGGQRGHRRDETVVHPVPGQRGVDEVTERIRAGVRHHGGTQPEPGRGHRHVGGAAAEETGERVHLGQRDAGAQWVQVDADPADGDEVVDGAHPAFPTARR